jgi:predicted PurR-regulated permease PerM
MSTNLTQPADEVRGERSGAPRSAADDGAEGVPQVTARLAQVAEKAAGSRAEAPRPWAWGRVRDVSWALLGIAGLLYVAFWSLTWVTGVLLLFVLAALLAFIIQPVVAAMERWLELSRTVAALICYLIVAVALGTVVAWGTTQLIEQATAVVANLPDLYQALQQRIPDLESRARDLGLTLDVNTLQAELRNQLPAGGNLATRGVEVAAKAGDVALNTFLVLFLSFYLVLDGGRLVAAINDIAPLEWKPYVRFVQQSLLRVVGGYLRGQLLMGAIIGVSVFVACLVLGIRYSLVLGALGFFFEMVPMVGPTLIGVAMVLAALLTSFKLALIALGFYLLLQLVESNVLGPRITGHAVGLHPIASMLGLVAGAKLFGLWGALFAVPVLGFAFVVVAAVYRQVRGLDPEALVAPKPAPRWAVPYPPHMLERLRRQERTSSPAAVVAPPAVEPAAPASAAPAAPTTGRAPS